MINVIVPVVWYHELHSPEIFCYLGDKNFQIYLSVRVVSASVALSVGHVEQITVPVSVLHVDKSVSRRELDEMLASAALALFKFVLEAYALYKLNDISAYGSGCSETWPLQSLFSWFNGWSVL